MTLIPATHFPARQIALAFSILTVLLSMLVASHPVIAGAIIYVDTTAGGANNGTSWGDAFTDLLTAISAASPGDELWIAEGAYHPAEDRYSTFLIDKNLTLLGGFPPGGDLSSRDPDLHPTVLSGDIGVLSESSDNVYHVVTVKGLGVTVLLDGLTISDACGNGSTGSNQMVDTEGGGINLQQANLTLNHVKIQNNRMLTGAGIYINTGTLQIHDSAFIGNTVNDQNYDWTFYGGGGIYNVNGSVTITGTRFEQNVVTNAEGGAIYSAGGTLSITGSVFKQNGAVFQQNGAAAADSPWGGAIYNNSTTLIVNSEFIANYSTSTLDKIAAGGAIYNEKGTSNSLKIANSIFDANTVTNTVSIYALGGAIASGQEMSIWSSAFVNNTAATGLALYNTRPTYINNTIFWGKDPVNPIYQFTFSDLHLCYVDSYGATTPDVVGVIMNIFPDFVDPANRDYHLKNTSRLIDIGNNDCIAPDFLDLDGDGDTREPIPFDKDGNPRRFDTSLQPNLGVGDPPIIDIGPYEVAVDQAPVNHAPVLDNTGSPTLGVIGKNDDSPLGNRVTEILASSGLGDPITDPDPNAVEGIAVVGVSSTNGDWQYSTDNGSSWKSFGAISDSSAVLLASGPNDRIRFVPTLDFCGEINPGLTFRAWDQTNGYPDGKTGVNISAIGGAAPYSQNVETAGIIVTCIPNHQPTLDDIPTLTILEDSPTVTIPLSGIGPGAGDEGQTLTFTTKSTDVALIPAPQIIYTPPDSNGTLRFTPTTNEYGNLNITVNVQDNGGTKYGGVDTITKYFRVNVLPVNDPPSFEKGPDITVLEDVGQVIIPGWASSIRPGPSNEGGQYGQLVHFELISDNPRLFSIQPKIDSTTGDLSFFVYPNTFGSAQITVQLIDNGGVENGGVYKFTTSFQVNVLPVNDPPSFTFYHSLMVYEDAGPKVYPVSIKSGPYNENSQALSLDISVDKPELFSSQPEINLSTGELSFTTAPNAFGSAQVIVQIQDDGGVENGGIDKAETTFLITIEPLNDAPTITDLSKDTLWFSKIHFTASDFTSHYQDIENESLLEIEIMSLPSHGTLLYQGRPVLEYQEINIIDLPNLVYVPKPQMWSGEDPFTYRASDGHVFSRLEAHVNITVSEYRHKYFIPLLFKRK